MESSVQKAFISQKTERYFFIALFLPIVGLVYSLWKWQKPWAKNVFWIGCIYLGTIHIYWPQGTILGGGADGGRLALRLIEWHRPGHTLGEIWGNYLVDQNTMDLYQQLMTYLVSRVTDNGHVLFFVLAVVFGFFYSRNIWYVLEKLPGKMVGKFFVIVTLFFLGCPITNINGARMWTALHVYVYAMMPYLLENDKSKLGWLVVVPLIHFSYLYLVLLSVVYYYLPIQVKKDNHAFLLVCFIFFVVTFFVNSINLTAVSSRLMKYSPNAYADRIEQYVNQDVMSRKIAAKAIRNWYVRWSGKVLFWGVNSLLMAIFLFAKEQMHKKELTHLYVFALLIGSLANLASLIPSGGRFLSVARMFQIPCILLVLAKVTPEDLFYKLAGFTSWWLVLPVVVEIRKLFSFYGITILGNFITVFFWENNVPLISFIKWLV